MSKTNYKTVVVNEVIVSKPINPKHISVKEKHETKKVKETKKQTYNEEGD
jgi:hypothetical protein